MDNYDEDDAQGRLSFCDFPLSANCDWDEVRKSSPSEDFFEFITNKDFFTGNYPNDNIIFCGKIIPYKTPKLPETTFSSSTQDDSKKAHKIDVSILASNGVKSSKWWMLAFGMGRFPMGKMELRDIKARQSRRNNSMKKVAASQPGVVGGNGDGKRGKGSLWGLLKLSLLRREKNIMRK